MVKTWDYVIVGSGSAGATLAGRLSQDPSRRVLLIEAGGWDGSLRMLIPGLIEGLLTSRTLNWSYLGEADQSLNGRRLTWAAGRVIGGSSSINGMVYGRGLPGDYDRWVAAGNPGWGWSDMAPYFKRLEHWTGPTDAARGTAGPIWVRRFEETDAACAETVRALTALGVPSVEDYSVGIVEGVALTQATQKRGLRHSAATAYLRPARRRPNLTVLTRTLALNLIMTGNRCLGVRALRNGKLIDLYAERETIVSAGAIGSPKLLMLSGVGPGDALIGHGVKTVHDLPGVGAHLNDHVNIKLSAFVNQPTYNTRRAGLSGLKEGVRLLATGSGAASSPANHAQAFVRTDPANPLADVQIQVMPFGFGSEADMARDGLTVVVSPCHPKVRGRISLSSADPAAPPRISITMLEQADDRAALLRGCKLALAALQTGPGRTLGGEVYAPSQAAPTDDEWLAFFRQTAALNWHPTSTCRMGPGWDDVVDHGLQIHGLTGVSVVDASIMPCVTSGNTNIPVIAIAERAADIITARTS
jgi:choline dehydrogenase